MKPRVLLAGNWAWDIYEEALARGFSGNGWEVLPFRTGHVPGGPTENSLIGRLRPAWVLKAVNEALIAEVLKAKPSLVFLWRCIDILPRTIAYLRKELPETTIVAYHNDNPFSGIRNRLKCRHFLASLKHVDVAAVYRPDNLAQALGVGAPRAELLLPSSIRALHRPLQGGGLTDVVYVGHYEPDGRLNALSALHDAGVNVQVRGTGWRSVQQRHAWLAQQPIQQLWGEDYVRALSNTKISLAFLSAKNGDVYTRRCFEIPACGSLLMAPRTDALREMFREDHEAIFWDTTSELVEKVKYYLANETERAEIAANGRIRVIEDGHDEYGRAKQICSWVKYG